MYDEFMGSPDPNQPGSSIGQARAAVYGFYDFDGEPIYVGQTVAKVKDRVGRHLTGQRSDPVAKFVLDPFEVAEVEVWTTPEITKISPKAAERTKAMRPYEATVYYKLKRESRFGAVLNEATPQEFEPLELPKSVRGRIIPDELWEDRKHPDIRIARRAAHVGRLAQLVSERQLRGGGLRRTLHLQTQRLEWLTHQRLVELNFVEPRPGEPTDVNED
ncbi:MULTISPECIES: GIY-YIG nuclease family protein [unclassified Micromonospora]|uniref:GIY-YIG nuclease family protein n=1 Tax=unclassified Micromonospora TaxID=2617518 RepID=UPI0033311539